MTVWIGLRAVAAWSLLLALATGAAYAQPADVPRDLYQEQRRQQGGRITFCVNAASTMAAFETALADELAAALLLVPHVVPIEPLRPTPPLDYRLPLTMDELFVFMAEDCDGFMGFTLASSGYPSWMIVTRPYLQTDTVVAVRSDGWRQFSDIPLDQPIGTRALGAADSRLLVYLQALPEDRRWRRFPYPNNELLLARLADGTIGAALIWEIALHAATGGDPSSRGIHVLEALPFDPPPTEFGIALRANDRYLELILGQAIDALAAEGRIAALLAEHGLAGPGGAAAHPN